MCTIHLEIIKRMCALHFSVTWWVMSFPGFQTQIWLVTEFHEAYMEIWQWNAKKARRCFTAQNPQNDLMDTSYSGIFLTFIQWTLDIVFALMW